MGKAFPEECVWRYAKPSRYGEILSSVVMHMEVAGLAILMAAFADAVLIHPLNARPQIFAVSLISSKIDRS